MYGGYSGPDPYITFHAGKPGRKYVLVTDITGNSCMLTVDITDKQNDPVVTAVTYEENPLNTTVTTTVTGLGTDNCVSALTTSPEEYFANINNDKLKPEKYDVTVDQSGNADLVFGSDNGDVSGLYATDFSGGSYFDCACVSGSSKTGTSEYKLVFHGKRQGSSKVYVQDKKGNSCIVNVTVKGKAKPEINSRLMPSDTEGKNSSTLKIVGRDRKYGSVYFDNASDYVFADIIEGAPELFISMYDAASAQGVRRMAEISTYSSGTYKVLFTDSDGKNTLVTVNVFVGPEEQPIPYYPVVTGVTDIPGNMTTDNDCVTTVTACTASAVIPTEAAEENDDFGEPSFPGDADLSGDVGVSDITAVGKYILNPGAFKFKSKAAMANADMNRDKKIDVLDGSVLIEINLGIISPAKA